ncbi:hypothetical protein LTR95_000509 [Oleoguttula sp. CCFEE 5521]
MDSTNMPLEPDRDSPGGERFDQPAAESARERVLSHNLNEPRFWPHHESIAPSWDIFPHAQRDFALDQLAPRYAFDETGDDWDLPGPAQEVPSTGWSEFSWNDQVLIDMDDDPSRTPLSQGDVQHHYKLFSPQLERLTSDAHEILSEEVRSNPNYINFVAVGPQSTQHDQWTQQSRQQDLMIDLFVSQIDQAHYPALHEPAITTPMLYCAPTAEPISMNSLNALSEPRDSMVELTQEDACIAEWNDSTTSSRHRMSLTNAVPGKQFRVKRKASSIDNVPRGRPPSLSHRPRYMEPRQWRDIATDAVWTDKPALKVRGTSGRSPNMPGMSTFQVEMSKAPEAGRNLRKGKRVRFRAHGK